MRTQKIDRSAWQSYLDAISKQLRGKQAMVEVASLGLGDQIEAEWCPLFGVVYDPKNDLVEVVLEGLDHMIRMPGEIHAAFGDTGLHALEIVQSDGSKQIVRLRDPLMLPKPNSAA